MKLLYLINCAWDWIFQRPQILALMLDKEYDCTIIEKKVVPWKPSTKLNPRPRKLKRVIQLRGDSKLSSIRIINRMIFRISLSKINEYDAIWICNPLQWNKAFSNYKGKIIYDYMDDYVSMATNNLKKEVYEKQIYLINRADCIFTSSAKLYSMIPCNKNVHLVRNGFVNRQICDVSEPRKKNRYFIGYIGTISQEWFDFNMLISSEKRFPNIEFHLTGPKDGDIQLDRANNIYFEGIVEHSHLGEHVDKYDALIMPFILNDTVLAVDPVKLYEYISFGKCIISVWYPEIERFSDFVYFYRDKNEFEIILDNLSSNGFLPKYDHVMQQEFLAENTWEKRFEIIKEELSGL